MPGKSGSDKKSYDEIRKVCEKTSRLSAKIVDEFLVGYVARRHGMEKEMVRQFDRYRHVTKEFQESWVRMLMSQYLEQQASVPWRFSFSAIMDVPEEDFS